MNEVLGDLDFCFVYIDDILIASSDMQQHLEHIIYRRIFERLSRFGIVVNPSKCIFAQEKVIFLGHEISASGIKQPTKRVQAIIDFLKPKTVS